LAPSPSPTVSPTFSPTTFFSYYDISRSLSLFSYSSVGSKFEFAANSYQGYGHASQNWTKFVEAHFAQAAFSLDYYFIEVWSSVLTDQDSRAPGSTYVSCIDPIVVNKIISALVQDVSATYSCSGATWNIFSGQLCVNCSTLCDLPSTTNFVVVPPTGTICGDSRSEELSKVKTATSVNVRSQLVVPESVPTFTLTLLSSTAKTVTVGVNLTSYGYGSVTYCGSFLSPITLTSQIKSQGIFVTLPRLLIFQKSQIFQSLTITNLIPSTNYSIYCFAEDSYLVGRSTGVEVSIQKKLSASTTCCRPLTFSNKPNTVSGVLSTYSGVSTTLYQFVYSIGSTPFSFLTVTPILSSVDGTGVGDIIVVPASKTFTSSDKTVTQLQGKFLLSGVSSANVRIELVLSGGNSALYSPPSPILVSVVNSIPIPSPPELISAVFDNSGSSMLITLSQHVDLIDALQLLGSDTWSCIKLFLFVNASASSCVWQSDQVVIATFSTSHIVPGDDVTLIAGVIKTSCVPNTDCSLYEYASSSTIVSDPPSDATTASPVLRLPSTLNPCNSFVVDTSLSTGHCGRSWKDVLWVVSSSPESVNVTSFLQILQSETNLLKNSIIEIPSSIFLDMLEKADTLNVTLTISLGLRNYLQDSSDKLVYTTRDVTVSSQYMTPPVIINGNSYRTITPSSELYLTSTTFFSECLSDNSTTYTWTVYDNYVWTTIKSSGKNKKNFYVAPYTLSAEKWYQIRVMATFSSGTFSDSIVTVYVQSDVISINLVGGISRFVAPNQSLLLDASNTIDLNLNSTVNSHLQFNWSCVYQSNTDLYGSSCDHSIAHCALSNTCLVPAALLAPNNILYFYLSVSDATRVSSESIYVEVGNVEVNATVSILSTFTVFNANNKLTIDAEIFTDQVVNASWLLVSDSHVDYDGSSVIMTSRTRQINPADFDAIIVNVPFPYSAYPNSFIPGREYTFRLSISDSSGNSLYSDITLSCNGPPTSGTISSTPSSGIAYDQIFLLNAGGWVDEIQDYPLTYTFKYSVKSPSLSQSVVYSPLRSASELPYLKTQLGQGLSSNNNTVYCTVFVQDIYQASSRATVSVISTVDTQNNTLDEIVESSIAKLPSLMTNFESDGVLAIITQISLSLSEVNCSLVSTDVCLAYHREECSAIINTCGSCLTGFSGVIGSSNTPCYESNSTTIGVGGSCNTVDSICKFGFCDPSTLTCQEYSKECPSLVSESQCSGHGVCSYTDGNGRSLNESLCTVSNTFCTASCACVDGYGGSACELTPSLMQNRSRSRVELCYYLVEVSDLLEFTSETLEALLGPFVNGFLPTEIVYEGYDSNGYSTCGAALSLIMDLIKSGYLEDYPETYISSISEALALYALYSNSSDSNTIIADSSSALTLGLINQMVPGQSSYQITNYAFTLVVGYHVSTDLLGASLSPPKLDNDYDQPISQIVLSGSGLRSCGVSDNGIYSKYGMLQWSAAGNPYNLTALGDTLRSPMIQFTTAFDTNDLQIPDSTDSNSSFTIVVSFNEPQQWNQSAPECVRLLDQSIYESSSCNLTEYTSMNATFLCENISSSLCSSLSSSRRLQTNQITHKNQLYSRHYIDSARGGRRRKFHELKKSDHFTMNPIARRQLQVDSAGGSSELTPTQYSSIGKSTLSEVRDTFNATPQEFLNSPIAISFVGCILFVSLIGYIYFAIWDRQDRNYEKYIVQAKDRRPKSKDRKRRSKELEFEEEDAPPASPNLRRQLSNALAMSFRKIDKRSTFFEEKVIETPETLVSAFVNRVLNSTGLLTERKRIFRFINALWREHPWIRPFTYSSSRLPRTLRYLHLIVETLILIFLDSLAFGLLFPDDATCQKYNSLENQCLQQRSAVYSGQQLCIYRGDETCDFNPPPNTLVAYVVLAVIISILSLVPKMINNILLIEFCASRPDFEGSELPEWFVHIFDSRVSPEDLRGKTFIQSELGKSISLDLDAVDEANDHLAILRYYDVASVDEELDFIVRSVRNFLKETTLLSPYPWRPSDMDDETQGSVVNREALMKLIGLNLDGTPSPMNVFQYLLYGSHHRYLRSKITHARKNSKSILYQLEDFGEDEQDNKDSLLIQHFLLEQLPPLQRLSLSSELFQFDQSDPPRVEWHIWFVAWILELSLIGFMLIWILFWAASNGQTVFKSWLGQFFYCIVEDVFISQVLLVFIIHVVVIEHMQPQLKHLSHTLNYITLQKITSAKLDGDNSRANVSAVQHISASCRVSRVETIQDLPSAMLLSSIEDKDVNILRMRRDKKLSLLATVLIGLPIVFGLLGENAQDMFFDILVACTWGAFLLFNSFLKSMSIYILVAVYVLLGLSTLYYALVYRPNAIKRHRKEMARGVSWKTSSRHYQRSSGNPFSSVIEFFEILREILSSFLFPLVGSSSNTQLSQETINWRNMNLMVTLPQRSTEILDRLDSYDEKSEGGSDIDETEKQDQFSLSHTLRSHQGFEKSHGILRVPSALMNLTQPNHVKRILRAERAIRIPGEIQSLRVAVEDKPPIIRTLFGYFNSIHSFFITRFRPQTLEVRWNASVKDRTPAIHELPRSSSQRVLSWKSKIRTELKIEIRNEILTKYQQIDSENFGKLSPEKLIEMVEWIFNRYSISEEGSDVAVPYQKFLKSFVDVS
jgi:hypothetical protein